jgi:hypothetical protein
MQSPKSSYKVAIMVFAVQCAQSYSDQQSLIFTQSRDEMHNQFPFTFSVHSVSKRKGDQQQSNVKQQSVHLLYGKHVDDQCLLIIIFARNISM